MLARIIGNVESRLEPHARAVSVLAAIWFWLGIAIYAGYNRLPDWPWLPDEVLFWSAMVFNAVWWGFLRPAIERRRTARQAP